MQEAKQRMNAEGNAGEERERESVCVYLVHRYKGRSLCVCRVQSHGIHFNVGCISQRSCPVQLIVNCSLLTPSSPQGSREISLFGFEQDKKLSIVYCPWSIVHCPL